jgi:hypothetical protein
MRLAELRTTVDAQKAKDKLAQEAKRAERLKKDKENPPTLRTQDSWGPKVSTGAFYSTEQAHDPTTGQPGQPSSWLKQSTVAEDYAASQPSRDDRPNPPPIQMNMGVLSKLSA